MQWVCIVIVEIVKCCTCFSHYILFRIRLVVYKYPPAPNKYILPRHSCPMPVRTSSTMAGVLENFTMKKTKKTLDVKNECAFSNRHCETKDKLMQS